MRSNLFDKMDKLPLKYFDKTSHGDTLSRMTNDIDTIGQALNGSVSTLFSSLTLIVGVFVMMLTISWQLTLVNKSFSSTHYVNSMHASFFCACFWYYKHNVNGCT